MSTYEDAFSFPDVAADALLMTPAVYIPEPDADGYGGVYAYNRDLRANISVAIRPYLEAAETEGQRTRIEADIPQLEHTLQAGFEDIDSIFYIAGKVLGDRQIEKTRHEGILRRSSRLAVSASRLDNTGLGDLLEAARSGKSIGAIQAADLHPPMEILGSDGTMSLSWSAGLLRWMKSAHTKGCPARSAVIEAEGQKRQTVMQLMWDRAVTAQYGGAAAEA